MARPRRLRQRALVLLAAIGVATSGCAADRTPPINGSPQALSPEELRLQAVETKVADLTRKANSGDSQGSAQLGEELRSLRGDVQQLRYDFDAEQKANAAQLQTLDQRLQRLEGATPGAAGAAPPGPADGSAPAVAPDAPSATEQSLYQGAMASLKSERFDDALRGFRAMLDQYPQGNLADNGWYWIGKTYYVKGDYASALQSFQTLLSRFPSSPKVPDASLDAAQSLLGLGKAAEGKAALQNVVQTYPSSNAAAIARSRLAQLH